MTADERRPLERLAASSDGAADALPTAHGFPLKVILGTIGTKLATATPEHVLAGGKPVEVTRVRITDAGRRALARE